jgi:hypothetical protein
MEGSFRNGERDSERLDLLLFLYDRPSLAPLPCLGRRPNYPREDRTRRPASAARLACCVRGVAAKPGMVEQGSGQRENLTIFRLS